MSKLSTLDYITFEPALEANSIVMVKFTAEWCAPCKQLEPILAEADANSGGAYKIYAVDIDQEPKLASIYSVKAVPTTIVFKNGVETNRVVGLATKNRLLALLK